MVKNPSNYEESTSDVNTTGKKNKNSLRAAKQPPVIKPEIIAFHASSFCRYPFTAQSNVENMPPQTPKLPPVTSARALIVEMEPARRSPYMSWQVWASLPVANTSRGGRNILLVSSGLLLCHARYRRQRHPWQKRHRSH